LERRKYEKRVGHPRMKKKKQGERGNKSEVTKKSSLKTQERGGGAPIEGEGKTEKREKSSLKGVDKKPTQNKRQKDQKKTSRN